MENGSSILTIFILFICVLTYVIYVVEIVPDYIEVEYSGIVTDKWSEYNVFFTFSNTKYILEIDNEFTKEVTHFEYRNIEINETFYYTEWEYV